MSDIVESIPKDNVSTTQGQLGWSSLDTGVFVRIFIVASFLAYFFWNEIDSIVRRWVTDPSWSHGFLIPFFSLYFLNLHRDQIIRLRTKPNYLGLFFLIFLLYIVYPLNLVKFSFAYIQPLTLIAAIGSVVLFLGGWRLVRYTWLPVSYLIFAVPIPERFYKALTIPMRVLAAHIASFILNTVPELETTTHGVVIDVVYKGVRMGESLDVAEACSGMRLLMAFLALGVAMAYLHYRPWWQRLILLCSTIPIAILCNIVRVTTTGFIYILIGPEYAQGIWHDLLGMLMLPLAFGLYGVLAWFMSSLFVDEDEMFPKKDIVIRRRNQVSD